MSDESSTLYWKVHQDITKISSASVQRPISIWEHTTRPRHHPPRYFHEPTGNTDDLRATTAWKARTPIQPKKDSENMPSHVPQCPCLPATPPLPSDLQLNLEFRIQIKIIKGKKSSSFKVQKIGKRKMTWRQQWIAFGNSSYSNCLQLIKG